MSGHTYVHVSIKEFVDVIRREFPMKIDTLVIYFNKTDVRVGNDDVIYPPLYFDINGDTFTHSTLSHMLELETRNYLIIIPHEIALIIDNTRPYTAEGWSLTVNPNVAIRTYAINDVIVCFLLLVSNNVYSTASLINSDVKNTNTYA